MGTKSKQGLQKGICKYCRAPHITQKTKLCPACNKPDPHITIAKKVRLMLQLGWRLQATRILTKIVDWDIEEALAYIESLSVETLEYPPFVSLVTSDDIIREHIMEDDLKGAIDYARKTNNPAYTWSSEEAMTYIRLICPDLAE
ncbi:hypothetical protein ACFL5F_04780 [Planctomycetota bacterium]